jgi:hypothetical protein
MVSDVVYDKQRNGKSQIDTLHFPFSHSIPLNNVDSDGLSLIFEQVPEERHVR